jgi:hypothetical protein
MCDYSNTHLMAMKSRRCTKSRKLKRRFSKKKGGMFRRATSDAAKKAAKKALKEIFGKDPVDAADKAKQTAEKVKDAFMKARSHGKSKQSPYMTAATFSSPVSFGSPIVSISGYDPNAFFRTPIKKPDHEHDEPLLGKTSRHQSAVARTPHSYAPRIGDVTPLNKTLRFENIEE